ncbi:uncharacterized protein AB675_9090 [Cyphellophora attinorum]|uniref:Peptidase A1 domain-containing protein n=1 Tax=Cyphellophora attinorum TaxID=1664694 RepID=A0A0N1P205_9EURO|nr:uncharacterized protein AB675_9090 [Phialophora attinorum]KPI41557.1 hypothetical protein AB675_9090 [Phialophora attinorum]
MAYSIATRCCIVAFAIAWHCAALETTEIGISSSAAQLDSVGIDGPWPVIEVLYSDGQDALQLYPTFLNASVLIRPQQCGDAVTNDTYQCSEVTYPRFYEANASGPTETLYNTPVNYSRPWTNTTEFYNNSRSLDVGKVMALEGGQYSLEDVNITIPGELHVLMPSYVIDHPIALMSNNSMESPLLTGLFSLPYTAARLVETGQTESEFFSIHGGSVEPNVPGSLVMGGYDNNRILGNLVNAGQTGFAGESWFSYSGLAITNVNIGVKAGFLPLDSLMFKNNSYPQGPYKQDPRLRYTVDSASTIDNIILDPGAPYFHLNSRICDPLAEMLGLEFDETRNLYLWTNEADDPIFRSPTFLEFEMVGYSPDDTFDYGTSYRNGAAPTISIKIPLAQLQHNYHSSMRAANGTLLPPARYFPCSTSEWDKRRSGYYRLGRPFFQAAFVAANHHFTDEPGILAEHWLAQAPGPDYIAEHGKDVKVASNGTIANRTTEVLEANAWTKSWSSVLPIWTLDVDGRALDEVNALKPAQGMSRARKLGLEIALPIVGSVVLGVALYFLIKGCKRSRAKWRNIQQQIAEEDATALEIENLLSQDQEKERLALQEEQTTRDSLAPNRKAPGARSRVSSISARETSHGFLPTAARSRQSSISSVSDVSSRYRDDAGGDEAEPVPDQGASQGARLTTSQSYADLGGREEAIRIWQRISRLADEDPNQHRVR